MYVKIKPIEDINFTVNNDNINLLKDNEYIIINGWLKLIDNYEILEDIVPKQYNINFDLNNKRLLFIRSYALGDALILSSLIGYIKLKYPSAKIDFAIPLSHKGLIDLIPEINNFVEFPIESNKFNSYDYHFSVAGVIENDTISENIYDRYFSILGCDNIDNCFKKPIFIKQYQPQIKNTIGLHLFARAKNRSYPLNLSTYLTELLLKSGKNVIIFSDEKQYKHYYKLFPPNCKWVYSDIYETYKQLSSCEKVISVDSFITHFAQSLNIPTVCLYGAFDSNSRVKYYKNITIIDTNPECRCMDHSGNCDKMFKNVPCMNIDPYLLLNPKQLELPLVTYNVTKI